MAGESYLLVVTSFAVSLNSIAENSSCSPAPHSITDVEPGEEGGRGGVIKSMCLLFSVIFFLVVSNL